MQEDKPILLFDFDDTLSEQTSFLLQYTRAIAEVLQPAYGGEIKRWEEAALAMMQTLEADYSARFVNNPLDGYCTWLERMRVRATELLFAGMTLPPPSDPACVALDTLRAALNRCRSLFPGAQEVVTQLHRAGYRLHMASGNDSCHLDAALQGAGIRPYFDRLYGPDLIDCAKEGPEYFERICVSLAASPREIVLIDNDPTVIGWATAAGIRAIQICLLPQRSPQQSPDASGCLQDLYELPVMIRSFWEPTKPPKK